MTKLRQSVVNLFGVCLLSGVKTSLASEDNVFADVYKNTRGMDDMQESGTIEMDVDLMSGIYRGEASVETELDMSHSGDSENTPSETEGYNRLHNTLHFGHASCLEETEDLLAAYEDIRSELSAIDQQYLQNASVENVCVRDGKISNCNFDFRSYPSNLESVCNNRGGSFYLTEHSIQCHNPTTEESLYYQFDHYPSCCSESCERHDANELLIDRIDSITEVMSDFLQMSCFADFDILRHATDPSSIVETSSGNQRSSQGMQTLLFSALPFLMINYLA